jgi:hypothetical protein
VPQRDRPGAFEAFNDRGVGGGVCLGKGFEPMCGGRAHEVDVLFHREGDAVEGRQVIAGNHRPLVCFGSGCERLVGPEGRDRVDRRIDRLYSSKMGLDHLSARYDSGADRPRKFDGGQTP